MCLPACIRLISCAFVWVHVFALVFDCSIAYVWFNNYVVVYICLGASSEYVHGFKAAEA